MDSKNETVSEWISVKNRLPRHGKEVLVKWKSYKGKKRIDIGTLWRYQSEWHFKYYTVDGANDLDDSQVTHWMPLPKI